MSSPRLFRFTCTSKLRNTVKIKREKLKPLRHTHYYSGQKGKVDFITQLNNGTLLPIEVKSGKDYKLHTALNNLLRTADYDIPEACALSGANISKEEREGKPVWYLPLYMAFCIAEQTNDVLEPMHVPPPNFASLL